MMAPLFLRFSIGAPIDLSLTKQRTTNEQGDMFSVKSVVIGFLAVILLFLIHHEAFAGLGRNEIGLKIGVFSPIDYEPYFPIQAEALQEYIRYDQATIHLFYLRNISSTVNAGLDIGFTGVVDKSDKNTILYSYPMDIYMAYQFLKLSGVGSYIGGGYTCWLMESKDDGMQAISGIFAKLEFVYLELRAEIAYSQIDHFGANQYDLGGWRARVGVSYQFSYY